MAVDFYVTEAAAARIAAIRENTSTRLRIAVQGGGCAGFSYTFLMDDAVQGDDHIFDAIDVQQDASTTTGIQKYQPERKALSGQAIIDAMSLDLLRGSTLDFQDDLAASMFVLKNPTATSGCGCGNSFSI